MMMEEILMDDEDLSVTGPVVLSTNEVPRVSLNSGPRYTVEERTAVLVPRDSYLSSQASYRSLTKET